MDANASIRERHDALRRAARHLFTRVAKCIDVEGGIFGKCNALGKLYQLFHLNNKCPYCKQ